jgi:hypothetical protein
MVGILLWISYPRQFTKMSLRNCTKKEFELEKNRGAEKSTLKVVVF